MPKASKKELARNRSRRTRQAKVDFQTGVAEAIGVAGGAYASGRFGLAGRPLAGPLTVGGAIGLGGALAQLIMPGADRVPVMAAVTSGALAIGGTELFLIGVNHRAKALIPG